MMNGGSIYDLQKILGHSKTEMTERYAHLAPDHLQKATNIISFSGKENQSVAHLSLIDNNKEENLIMLGS